MAFALHFTILVVRLRLQDRCVQAAPACYITLRNKAQFDFNSQNAVTGNGLGGLRDHIFVLYNPGAILKT